MAQLMREDMKKRVTEVDRLKLVEILQTNRQKHINDYKEALAGYREQAATKFQEAYEQAKVKLEKNLKSGMARIEEFDPANPKGMSDYLVLVEQIGIEMRVPKDYSKEYDAAIDMAKWDVRETLELSHAEFQCFVRDEWDWTNEFAQVSMLYKSKSFS